MKKTKIIIVIIWILSIAGIVLYSKNIKQNKKTTELVEEPIEHQYIDYTGFYDENDLSIEKLYLDDEEHFSYIKISGLKDKKIEKKVNEKLYKLSKEEQDKGARSNNSYISLNAFNILSVYETVYEEKDYHYKTLNIDLTTGNEIKLKDVLNETNMVGPISRAYYDTASFAIQAEIKNLNISISMYNSCKERNEDCSHYEGNLSIDKKIKLEEMLNNIEDISLSYARNFNYDDEFIITSEGIEKFEIEIEDINNYKDLIIHTKNNPQLFNFYYKYKTNESIFDGSYKGRKNIFISDYYNYRHEMDYDIRKTEYGIIDYSTNDSEDNKKEIIKKYLDDYEKKLDKNIFTVAKNFETYGEISFIECKMSKEIYNNEMKKIFADEKINSRYNRYSARKYNDEVTCEDKIVFYENTNIEFTRKYVDDESITDYIVVSGLEELKRNEINDTIKNKAQELKRNNNKNIFMNADKITNNSFEIKIYYWDSNDKSHNETITFDF